MLLLRCPHVNSRHILNTRESKLRPSNSSMGVQALSGYQVKSMDPFSPVSKKTSATFTTPDGKSMMACKGAPQVGSYIHASVLFPLCNLFLICVLLYIFLIQLLLPGLADCSSCSQSSRTIVACMTVVGVGSLHSSAEHTARFVMLMTAGWAVPYSHRASPHLLRAFSKPS